MGWRSSPKDPGWTLKEVFLSCHHLGLHCFFPKVHFFRVTWFQRPPGWWLPQVSLVNIGESMLLENRELTNLPRGTSTYVQKVNHYICNECKKYKAMWIMTWFISSDFTNLQIRIHLHQFLWGWSGTFMSPPIDLNSWNGEGYTIERQEVFGSSWIQHLPWCFKGCMLRDSLIN